MLVVLVVKYSRTENSSPFHAIKPAIPLHVRKMQAWHSCSWSSRNSLPAIGETIFTSGFLGSLSEEAGGRATFRRSFSRKTSERPSQDKILHTGEHRELWLSPCENGPIPGQTARAFVKTRFDGKKTNLLKSYLLKKNAGFQSVKFVLKMLHYHQES